MKDYNCECIFYLGIEIIKYLKLENRYLYIDEYYNVIKEIYNDYQKYDNKNKSLLDSIDEYINKRISEIRNKVKIAINK